MHYSFTVLYKMFFSHFRLALKAIFIVFSVLVYYSCSGYNLIGYEMSRPELRAELEADLRKICEGKAAKDAVLRRHIAKYKRVFMEAVSKAEK